MRRDPITLYVYVSRTGTATGRLYLDDGETYSYQNGAFIERELSFENATLTSRPSPRTKSSPEQLEFLKAMSKVRVERVVVVGMRNPLTKAVVVENGQTRDIELAYAGSKLDYECTIRDPAVLVGNDWEITLS
ncbi:glucosidase II [Coemansia sp. RSA 2337]|nr:glucosidase II [Coemansia sp. RSA 2337]